MEVRELPRAEGGFIDGNLNKYDRRERCKRCLQHNPIGFHVPDEVWAKVNELATQQAQAAASEFTDYPQGPFDILCLSCFVDVADWNGVEWDRDIKFWPESRYSAVTTEMETV